jgi:hypothetical protein
VGTYTESTTLRLRSLYWSTPTSAPVPLPVNVDASEVGAEAINNRGWIVGHVRHAWPSDLDTRAVIWKIRR